MLLRDIDRDRLIDIFQSIDTQVEVWAYGSRVNGRAHDGSDLDLVVRTHDLSPMSLEQYAMIIDLIHDSLIPILVDVKDWARLPDYFHDEIKKNYEVLYKSTGIAAEPSADYGKSAIE